MKFSCAAMIKRALLSHSNGGFTWSARVDIDSSEILNDDGYIETDDNLILNENFDRSGR
jgi:hypothetical protein